MLDFIFGNGQLRAHHLDRNAIPFLDLFAQIQRLLKLVARVEVENSHARLDFGEHVNQTTTFCTECRRHREPGVESLHSPAQDLLRRTSVERVIGRFHVFRRKGLRDHAAS